LGDFSSASIDKSAPPRRRVLDREMIDIGTESEGASSRQHDMTGLSSSGVGRGLRVVRRLRREGLRGRISAQMDDLRVNLNRLLDGTERDILGDVEETTPRAKRNG
jgi:hypothetical protein